jgi:8-oxo-dGTP pyrophosphatase MutT (NUDIX family)
MTIEKTSSGMIIFRLDSEGNRRYLLLRNIGGHWEFPKGGIEGNESDLEASLREVSEETGLDPMKINSFRVKYSYQFSRNGETINKEVYLYLGKSFTDNVSLSREHRDYCWLKYEDALRRISNSHSELKAVLREAHSHLEEKNIK